MGWMHRHVPLILLGIWCFGAMSLYTAPGAVVQAGSTSQDKSAIPAKEKELLESPYSHTGSYLAARHARRVKDNDQASHYFSHALSHDPYDIDLMKETVRTYVMSGRMDEAAEVARSLSSLKQGSQVSRLVLFINVLKKGNLIEARSEVEKMQKFGLFGIIQPILMGWMDTAEGKAPDKIELPESLHGLEYFNHLIHYQLALMNDVADNRRAAREHYQQALKDLSLASYRMIVAAMQFYHRVGEHEMADRLLVDFVKANPNSQLLDDSNYAEIEKDLMPEDREKLVRNASQGVAEFLYTVAGVLFSEDVSSETQMYLRMAIYLRPEMQDGLLMLGNLMEDQKELAEATKYYAMVQGQGPIYRRAQVRLAFALDELNKKEEAVTILNKLAASFPQHTDHYVTLGDIFRRHNQYREAVTAYSSALKTLGNNITEEHWPILFARGISYERSGEWEKAEQDFQSALKIYPDQPDVLNYLGYSWLVQGKKLDEAKKMLEQAISERPEDPHIIDSMGWAFYMLGDYENALKYMEDAVDRMPHDPTVNDHLGDVLYRIGRKTEAKFQWERALTFGPEEDDRKRIEQKLKTGTIVENPVARTAAN